ncbi:MAG: hypothetical protein FH762_06510 [Firmicutes bacterium]|nr:hypothetical protein [Bacillota bacterium]
MGNKRRVCFACLTSYNLFISYILSRTVYRNDYKILMLSDIHNLATYSRIIKYCNIWDEVFLIREDKKPREQRFIDIRQQLQRVNFTDLDILHYFTFASGSFGFILLDYIPNTTKIILTQDGVMTYYFKETFNYCRSKWSNIYNRDIDFNRTSEIWLFDKNLDANKLLKRPVRNIGITEYIKNSNLLNLFCIELNKIFNYNHKPLNYDVIFLEQQLSNLKVTKVQQEKYLFSLILNELKGYRVLVKMHTSSNKEKYNEYINVNCLKDNVPWEFVLLNELNSNRTALNSKIFMSYHSTALINTQIILRALNIPSKAIWMCDLLQNFIKKKVADEKFPELVERFKVLYKQDLYDVKSIDELRNTLKTFQ